MPSRYDPVTRRALILARDEAIAQGASEVTPEYLALGLVAIQSAGLQALLDELKLDMTPAVLGAAFERHAPKGKAATKATNLPLSEAARMVLINAEQEAADMRHDVVGPEHILLGLIRVPRTSISRFFERLVSLRQARDVVREMAERRQSMPDVEPQSRTAEYRREHDFTIIWDPAIVEIDDYARLVSALGELVRAAGGTGVERLDSISAGVPVGAGVLV
jgi:ATP-dependent Clp protease ATP-binding subunit ClpA